MNDDALVEKVARALYEHQHGGWLEAGYAVAWPDLDDINRSLKIGEARAAIRAYREGTDE